MGKHANNSTTQQAQQTNQSNRAVTTQTAHEIKTTYNKNQIIKKLKTNKQTNKPRETMTET